MKKLFFLLIFLVLGTGLTLRSQNLDDLLESEAKVPALPVDALFKATRVVNGHSVKQLKKGDLDYRISHRFGRLNSGAYNFFGLDQSTMHLSFEYGVFDRLLVGIGRGTFEKTVDAFIRYNIANQSVGSGAFPLTISYLASAEAMGLRWADTTRNNYFSSRLSYVHQLLIARKFSKLTVQLMPTLLHRNLVPAASDQNDLLALGIAGRYKIANRLALTGEYFYVFGNDAQSAAAKTYNPLSFGFDIETGGHVFQIMVTNSQGMREGAFLGKTAGSWRNGDIHLGFNISRVFTLNSKKQS